MVGIDNIGLLHFLLKFLQITPSVLLIFYRLFYRFRIYFLRLKFTLTIILLKQGIEDTVYRNGNSTNYFLYVGDSKYFKELCTLSLNGIVVSG